MDTGSQHRKANYPVDRLFMDRWSPRAMSGESIAEADLMTLFEAARWAPSSNNNQPWRILYARRESEHWPLFLGLLTESNKVWAQHAAALLLFISKTTFDFNGKPSVTHSFDTGAAWENLALQGWLNGHVVHGMQGFDYVRAKAELRIPDAFQIEAMVAVGKPGAVSALPQALQQREFPSDRRGLQLTVCEGPFQL
ncbi:MAG: oxidoreductase [Burkholderiaceae bacterium]|nr:oxidoreductase [Burkholderiaceae bacterium]